jgi:hypothetical protein
VVELGEGWVEDGGFDAVLVDLEFGEEGLVEGAAVGFGRGGVELVAVFEEASRRTTGSQDSAGSSSSPPRTSQ